MNTNKIYSPALLSFIFLILFFLSSILAHRYVIKGEMVTVPDIVGKTMNEAKTELVRKRLSLVKKGEQFDAKLERGKIIAQEPSSGSKVNFNEVIKVTLSSGQEKVLVPRLVGRNFQLIREILEEGGVTRGIMSHVHTPKYSAGRIIAQYPPAAEEVGRGMPISLLISEGEWEEKYLMPDLIGKKTDLIIPWLEGLGFKVEDVRNTYYPGLESGVIIKQAPRQGYVLQKNYPIRLEVSK